MAQDYYTLMFVLDHSKSEVGIKGEAVSAFLQYASEISSTGVRNYYFNSIIKPKFFGYNNSEATVTKSIALFDVIVSNIRFDFSYVYSAQLDNILHLWRDNITNNTYEDADSFEDLFLEKKSYFEDSLESVDKWLGLRS